MEFKIIAIDGPSGVGKSTISNLLAERLGFFYVDTGAMFRCLAWNWERQGCPENKESLLKLGNQTEIIFENEDIICNATSVTHLIRTERISRLASKISVFPSIREVMKKQQREIVKKVRKLKKYHGAVLEGRDIGTIVFPEADFKFFLEASPEVRAKRRMLQIHGDVDNSNYENILEALNIRDNQDKNRKVAPLKAAEDAIIVDTASLSVTQVLENLLSHFFNKEN